MSDLLPPNASKGERAISLAIERHAALPTPMREVWDADTCPADLLAWLAWSLTVDEWDSGWTDAQKRGVIKASIQVHRFKGSIGAVREALGALSYTARVQEWFNQIPAGAPYTFRLLLDVDQVGITQAAQAALQTALERTKNLRSHLERIEPSVTTRATLTVAACAALGTEIVLTNYQPGAVVANETTICF